jgi:hypothetical protein
MSDPFDELLDPEALAKAPREDDAEARIAKARRIAAANNRLAAAGEIADGTGKPAARRVRRAAPWVAIGAVTAVVIVVLALVAR